MGTYYFASTFDLVEAVSKVGVPPLLINNQKQERVTCSKDNLQLLQRNSQDYCRHYITME